jgi:hypothetical protein
MKQETLDRCRNAFDVLTIMLDREPTQREVSRVAGASSATVSSVWDELTVDDTDDGRPLQVAATRSCLCCRKPFPSRSVGHRICPRCKGLEAWQAGVADFAVTMSF